MAGLFGSVTFYLKVRPCLPQVGLVWVDCGQLIYTCAFERFGCKACEGRETF